MCVDPRDFGVGQLAEAEHDRTEVRRYEWEARRYEWTEHTLDVDEDMQYQRARCFDPSVGRWLSGDPLGYDAGEEHLYRYAT
jgi:RHS repeat-associated protein